MKKITRLFSNINVRLRLRISYLGIAFFAICIAFFGLHGNRTTMLGFEDFTDTILVATSEIKDVRISTNTSSYILAQMLMDENPDVMVAYRDALITSLEDGAAHIQALKAVYPLSDNLITDLESVYSKWEKEQRNVADVAINGDVANAKVLLIASKSLLKESSAIAQEITTNLEAATEESVQYIIHESNIANLNIIVFVLFAIVVCFIFARAVSDSVVYPVQQIEEAADNLSKGVLKSNITWQSKDELGRMAQKLHDSLTSISTYVHDIDEAMSAMAQGDFNISTSTDFIGEFKSIESNLIDFSYAMSAALGQIDTASTEVEEGATLVANSSQNLSRGSIDQAASIEKLAATINDVSDKVNTNAANAQKASDLAQKVGAEMHASNEQMSQLRAAMQEISDTSNEIGKIIKTIDDIAFQTNILALNAAVEAARAGAAGKGFAVVADEVRNLASKSAEAAKNTTTLIESSISAIDKGAKIAVSTADSLLTVVEGAEDVISTIGEIASASEEQAASIAEVTIGIDQINGVVQSNSATAQECAATSEELNGQAETLRQTVSQFKLRQL